MQNILQGLHKDLVSYLLKSKLVFEILEVFIKISKTSLGSMGFNHFYEIYSSDYSVAKIWSAEFTWNLRNSSFKNSAKVYGEFFAESAKCKLVLLPLGFIIWKTLLTKTPKLSFTKRFETPYLNNCRLIHVSYLTISATSPAAIRVS